MRFTSFAKKIICLFRCLYNNICRIIITINITFLLLIYSSHNFNVSIQSFLPLWSAAYEYRCVRQDNYFRFREIEFTYIPRRKCLSSKSYKFDGNNITLPSSTHSLHNALIEPFGSLIAGNAKLPATGLVI